MKKYLLLGVVLLWTINFFAQRTKNTKDEFTYKTIKVTNATNGILPISGSNNSTTGNNLSSMASMRTGGSGIGETTGNLSVSLTGGATYEVPIEVPPGINGVIPKISLKYNSQNGNGLAGYGWDISGVSVISRIASTKYHDNNIDAVDFDNLDRFSLDGERLVLKSGTYGSNGAQYATENYSNLKITSYGTSSFGSNYGPSYFIIYYPDGSFAHYGNSTDSNSHTNYAITYWQNPQGIRISYEYLKKNNGLAIQKIKYGNQTTSNPINEIYFKYKNRKRPEQSYVGGVQFIRDNILDEISILSGGVGYKHYKLGHDYTNLEYERLVTLQEKSGNKSKIHSPIYFDYSASTPGVSFNAITTDISIGNIEQRNAETFSLDLTGNGKMDFVVSPKTNKNKFWVFKDLQNGSPNYPIEVNSGSFESIFPVSWLTHNNKILSEQGITIIQKTTNNDVKFKVYSNGTTAPIYYQYEKLWDAPTYTQRTSCNSNPTTHRIPQKYISGDFNGDGLSDIIAINELYDYYNCIDNDLPEKQQTTARVIDDDDGGGSDCDCNPVSVNYSKAYFINLDRRVVSNFTKSLGYLVEPLKYSDKLFTVDANGDGKTDILHVTEGKIYVYTMDTNGNLQLLWQTIDSKIKIDFPLLFGDYNGDGKTDFMVPLADNSNTFFMFFSSGLNFIKKITYYYPFKYKENRWDGSSSTLYGYNLIPLDVNGDGRTDVIEYSTETYNNNSNGKQTMHLYKNFNFNSANTYPKFSNGGYIIKYGNLKHYPIPIFLTSDKENKNLDFASISNNWITNFSFNQDHREDMLLRSIENNGVSYNIGYNNLDSSEQSAENMPVYSSSYSESYPNTNLQIALGSKVVTKLERICSGSTTIKQLYSYYGGVYNMEGLGFLGFQGIAKSNWHSEPSKRMFSVTKNSTELRGAITDEYVARSGFSFTSIPSNYISKTSNTYSSSIAGNRVFKLSNSSSITQNSLEGTTINKSFIYDNYNNPTDIHTNYSGDGSSTINITYANNTGSTYYIGRPMSESETTTIDGNSFNTEKQFTYTGYLLTQKKQKVMELHLTLKTISMTPMVIL